MAFSELEEVIDQPFWTYSTGMQARLTFSTAVSVDPDVLIIDEALSVGDTRFASKCCRRMMDFRERGKTIVLVSHEANAVLTFCERAIVLEGGQIYADGDPREVPKVYGKLVFSRPAFALEDDEDAEESACENRHGDGKADILDFGILDTQGNKTRNLELGARYRLRFVCREAEARLSCGCNIFNPCGVLLYGVTNQSQRLELGAAGEGEVMECSAAITAWLAAGDYIVSLGVADADSDTRADFIEDAVHFRVHGPGGIFTTSMVNLQTEFSLRRKLAQEDVA
ncbi:MAG: hypothetical protein GKR94_04755 [Gammaproteobacteria bacterium]|nr:hypothetical protein [Gammaproteobacteria bacterium]